MTSRPSPMYPEIAKYNLSRTLIDTYCDAIKIRDVSPDPTTQSIKSNIPYQDDIRIIDLLTLHPSYKTHQKVSIVRESYHKIVLEFFIFDKGSSLWSISLIPITHRKYYLLFLSQTFEHSLFAAPAVGYQSHHLWEFRGARTCCFIKILKLRELSLWMQNSARESIKLRLAPLSEEFGLHSRRIEDVSSYRDEVHAEFFEWCWELRNCWTTLILFAPSALDLNLVAASVTSNLSFRFVL